MNIEEITEIDISFVENTLEKNKEKKIIIFGIGTATELFMKHLSAKYVIDYFVDNKSNSEKFLNIYNVYSPERLLKEKKDDIFVLILAKYTIQIKKQLVSYGFENTSFFDVYSLYEDYFTLHKTILRVNDFEHFLNTLKNSSVNSSDKRKFDTIAIYGKLDVRGAYLEYCLTWAIILMRKGYEVTFVLDDLETIDLVRYKVKIDHLRKVENHILKVFCEKYPELRIKRIYNPHLTVKELDEKDEENINKVMHDSAIWHESRLDALHINLNTLDYEKLFLHNMKKNYPHIKDFLEKNDIVTMISNDLIETQGLIVNCARSMGIACVVYDGPFFNLIGGASQGFDLGWVFKNNLLEQNFKKYIINKAKHEFKKIQEGKEIVEQRSHYQRASVKNLDFDNDILILLNFEWDAAVLGLNSAFRDFSNWLYETLDYIIYNTSAKVIVRDHPGKVFYCNYVYKNFKKILTERYHNDSRLTYIEPEATCNTYSYIKASKLILTYSSTSGIDSYLLGKNVLLGAKTFYSDFGFAFYKETKKEYFDCIDYLLHNTEHNDDYSETALITFYLIRQMWCQIDFNSNKSNWMYMNYDEIEKQANIALEAIEKRLPVGYLKTLHDYNSAKK